MHNGIYVDLIRLFREADYAYVTDNDLKEEFTRIFSKYGFED